MAQRRIKIILTYGSIATTAFYAGKYHETGQPQADTKSILGSVISTSLANNESSIKSFVSNSLNKIHLYVRNIFPQDFGSIKAASPIPEPLPNVQSQMFVSNAGRVSQIMKYGFPGMDNILSFSDFILSYDKRNKVAHWVFEHLTAESVRKNDEIDRSKCDFKEDDHLHPYFRSRNTDFKGSGYDRGHLAAAGNHKSCQQHVQETFYLSNMAPQVGKGFNRDSWNRLEKYVRKLTKTYTNVYCCTGPLYLPKRESNGKMYIKYEVIGANHVAVPTHFFKVVLGETPNGKLEMESYVMENTVIDDSIPLKSFQVPLELIEKSAGLLIVDSTNKAKISKINGK